MVEIGKRKKAKCRKLSQNNNKYSLSFRPFLEEGRKGKEEKKAKEGKKERIKAEKHSLILYYYLLHFPKEGLKFRLQ